MANATASGTHTSSSAEYIVSGIKRHKLVTFVAAAALAITAVAVIAYLRGRKNEVSIDSIAVLPFENRSADAETEYLSDGLAESLIYRLSQLPNLKVTPTSMAFQYKGKETSIRLEMISESVRCSREESRNAVTIYDQR